MKQDLTQKIYDQMDMIHIMCRLTSFAVENSMENLQEDSFCPIFDDIRQRCHIISGLVEELEEYTD